VRGGRGIGSESAMAASGIQLLDDVDTVYWERLGSQQAIECERRVVTKGRTWSCNVSDWLRKTRLGKGPFKSVPLDSMNSFHPSHSSASS